MENTEILVWLDYAIACKYINEETYNSKLILNEEVGKLIGHAISNINKY